MRKLLIGMIAVAGLALAGCGGEGEPAGEGGGTATAPTPVGTWVLDKEDFKGKLRGMMADSVPAEHLDEAMKAFDSLNVVVRLAADNTFTADVTKPPAGPGTSAETEGETGTWSVEGDQLSWTVETRGGEPLDPAESHTGTWSGDMITAQMDEVSPPIILRRS